MEVFRINIKSEEEILKHETFIQAQNNCPLCSHTLDLNVQLNKNFREIKEQATCPSCHVQLKPVVHVLQ